MQTEYEATFFPIAKDEMRKRLKKAGAKLIRPEFMQRRSAYNFPSGHTMPNAWVRVRDEVDKITMSLKIVANSKTISDQKELQIKVDNFEDACEMLSLIGCEEKAYQESYREIWNLDETEITIDEWPFLEPFVEIEGKSEEMVIKVSEKLGFEYSKAYFGSADGLYSKKYGISVDRINNHTPEILFKMKRNPFVD